MKTNKILLLILLGFSLSSFSQKTDHLSKGNWFLEAGFTGEFPSNNEMLIVRPTFGVFVKDKWAVGFTSNLEFVTRRFSESSGGGIISSSTQLEGGLFTQYYFTRGLYGKISATAGNYHLNYPESTPTDLGSYTISPEIGYDFFLGKKKRIAVGTSLAYYLFDNTKTSFNNSNFRFNLSIKFMIEDLKLGMLFL